MERRTSFGADVVSGTFSYRFLFFSTIREWKKKEKLKNNFFFFFCYFCDLLGFFGALRRLNHLICKHLNPLKVWLILFCTPRIKIVGPSSMVEFLIILFFFGQPKKTSIKATALLIFTFYLLFLYSFLFSSMPMVRFSFIRKNPKRERE